MREPKRGGRDGAAMAATDAALDGATLGARIRLLLARPGLGHCIIAIILIATGIYGMSTWLTTFLIRVHGLPISKAGLSRGNRLWASWDRSAGFWRASARTGSTGGWAASIRRAPPCSARSIPVLTAITGVGTVAFAGLPVTLAFMMASGFMAASYNGPIYAVIVHIAGSEACAGWQYRWCSLART